ncbi:MAG: FMN-binding protein, partial [Carboxylicivirga sp.]|nr:FMN-binding protein [Carboxylicivirga sp.]
MQRHHIESIANMVLLLLFFMAAVSYNGKLFGHKPENLFSSNKETVKIDPPNAAQLSALGLNNVILEEQEKGKWTFSNGQSEEYILNTNAFSKGIFGFAGPTPMYLYLDKDQRLKQVLLFENNETPEFMVSVHEQGIIQQWIGRSPAESVDIKPDVVTGATITSNAINRSIQASLAVVGNTQSSKHWYASFDLKTIVALLVIVFGIFVSFRAKKIKWLRTIQLALNTLILGFWCGKFISLQTLLGWTANGMNLLTSLVVILMLTLAIVM